VVAADAAGGVWRGGVRDADAVEVHAEDVGRVRGVERALDDGVGRRRHAGGRLARHLEVRDQVRLVGDVADRAEVAQRRRDDGGGGRADERWGGESGGGSEKEKERDRLTDETPHFAILSAKPGSDATAQSKLRARI